MKYKLSLIQFKPIANSEYTSEQKTEFIFEDYKDVIAMMTLAIKSANTTVMIETMDGAAE